MSNFTTQLIITDQTTGDKLQLDYTDISLPITYSVNDVRNLGERDSAYSKTIKLPGTANNNRIFQSIFNVNVKTKFKVNKKTDCVVISDSLPILYGYLQLVDFNEFSDCRIEYECILKGELASFVNQLGTYLMRGNIDANGAPLTYPNSSKLVDLNFDELTNNPYDGAFVPGTWTGNSSNTRCVYPFIDYGYNWHNRDYSEDNVSIADTSLSAIAIVPLQSIFPSIWVKRIVDKIFENAGFTYISDFFETDFFNRLFLVGQPRNSLSPINAYIGQFNKNLVLNTPGIANYSGVLNFADSGKNSGDIGSDPAGLFQVHSTASGTFNSDSGYGFVPSKSGDYTINVSLTVKNTGGSNVTFLLPVVDGSTGNAVTYLVTSTTLTPGSITTFNVNSVVTLTAGVNYHIFYEVFLSPLTLTFNYNSKLTIVPHNQNIDVSEALPTDYKQVDFIRDLVKMFNLIIEPDKNNPNLLYIEPRDNYYSQGKIVDWSQKIDRNSDYQLKILSELTGQMYQFSYSSDNDYLNKTYSDTTYNVYGEENITIDNDFVTDTTEIKTTCAPTLSILEQNFTNFIVPSIASNSFKPRILYKSDYVTNINKVPGTEGDGKVWIDFSAVAIPSAVSGYSGISGTSGVTQYYYAGQSELVYNSDTGIGQSGITSANAVNLNFGNIVSLNSFDNGNLTNTLFNNYYQNFISSVASPQSKVLRAKFYLTATDINSIRFNDTILLNIENNISYWHINQIVDYNPITPELTEVELVYIDVPESLVSSEIRNNRIIASVIPPKVTNLNNQNATTGVSGYSGTSGYSGFSGYSGYSGFSGKSGFSGQSGYSGFSGYSGQNLTVSGVVNEIAYFNTTTTLTGNTAFLYDGTNMMIGTSGSNGKLNMNATGSWSASGWGVSGRALRISAGTLTDTSTTSGTTVASIVASSFQQPTFTAANATSGSKVTYTDAATLYSVSPTSGVNTLLTNSWAAWFNGNVKTDGYLTASLTGSYSLINGVRIGSVIDGSSSFTGIATNSASTPLYISARATSNNNGGPMIAMWPNSAGGGSIGLFLYGANNNTGQDISLQPRTGANNAMVFESNYAAASWDIYNPSTLNTNQAGLLRIMGTSTQSGGLSNGVPQSVIAHWYYRIATDKKEYFRTGLNAGSDFAGTGWTSMSGGTGGDTYYTVYDVQNSKFLLSLYNGFGGVGVQKPTSSSWQIAGDHTLAAWGTIGPGLRVSTATFTDNTSAAGLTIASAVGHSINIPTFTASLATSGSKVTYTDAATLYIAGNPALGANTLATNQWGIWNAGNMKIEGTRVNIKNLPTSPVGLATGDIWNNGGVLNIV